MEKQSNSPASSLFQTNRVYVHFVTPSVNNLNKFQQIIQPVQKLLSFSKWPTTHVFVSCNGQVIDRSGVFTVTKTEEAIDYLKSHYSGCTIDSYGSDNPVISKNFSTLYNFIKTKQDFFFEDEYGEVYGKSEYQPNNTVYGVGSETWLTLKDVFLNFKNKITISEQEAINEAKPNFDFKISTQLKNPTYCSLTLGGLFQGLNGQTILRYPALTHSFFDSISAQYKLDYIKTVVQ